jgi:hypothetical protein
MKNERKKTFMKRGSQLLDYQAQSFGLTAFDNILEKIGRGVYEKPTKTDTFL